MIISRTPAIVLVEVTLFPDITRCCNVALSSRESQIKATPSSVNPLLEMSSSFNEELALSMDDRHSAPTFPSLLWDKFNCSRVVLA